MGNTNCSQNDEYPPFARDWYYRIFGEVIHDQQPPMVMNLCNQFFAEDEFNHIFQGGVHQSSPAFNHIHQSFHPRLAEFEDLVRILHTTNFGNGTAAGNRDISHGSTSSAAENQGNFNPNNPMSYEELQILQENIGCVSKELPERLIARLPSHKHEPVSSEGKGKSAEEIKECVICKVNFKKGDMLITLPCLHQYHDHCIKEWFRNSKVCCICKQELNFS